MTTEILNTAISTLLANLAMILIVVAVWGWIMSLTENLDGQERYKERTTYRKLGEELTTHDDEHI